jgi:hypothetical protein
VCRRRECCGCSSTAEHLLAKQEVASSNLVSRSKEDIMPMVLKGKYRSGKQYKGVKGKGAGDNPSNNPNVARKRGRIGMNMPKEWGLGK